MAFSGTVQKCKSCDKVVHFAEMMSTDGLPFHKTCFRCSQCNTRLTVSNSSNLNGTLYCKPHFQRLLKESGGLASKFHTASKPNGLTRAPSKVSTFFAGTQEKCSVCNKTVYPLEKITVEGLFFHKQCFKCAHGGCKVTPSSYAALDGIVYCKPHFSQLFKEKGSYSHLTKTTSKKINDAMLENLNALPKEESTTSTNEATISSEPTMETTTTTETTPTAELTTEPDQ
ncbi:actin or actin-binding cytoskeletal protein [Lithospermum erythrorhizon]|uniref:Actin or actin-binding cytoskeletal protein n=1 Tax=Lithospermum erythrorhizon TaxID=34254 RepID=A0AAV3RYN9_LITER